jgi:hypothetical protein
MRRCVPGSFKSSAGQQIGLPTSRPHLQMPSQSFAGLSAASIDASDATAFRAVKPMDSRVHFIFRIPRHAAMPNPAPIRIAAAPQMRPQDACNVGWLAGSS